MKRILLNVMLFCMTGFVVWADNTNPIAIIDSPSDSICCQRTINITGIACPSGGESMKLWIVEINVNGIWQQINSGTTSIGNPISWQSPDPDLSNFLTLGTLNTRNYVDGSYIIKLTVVDNSNKVASDTSTIEICNFYQGTPICAAPKGVSGVPKGGTYEYTIDTSQNNIPKAKTWHVSSNGTVLSGSSRTKYRIKWSNTAPAEGEVYYDTDGNFESNRYKVGIFTFNVIVYSDVKGNIVSDSTGNVNGQGVIVAKSGSSQADYAFSTNASISASGPTINNVVNYGISNLRVGYIQNGKSTGRDADYENNLTLTHPSTNDTNWYIDKVNPNNPWYNTSGCVQDYSPTLTSRWIYMYDYPNNWWPKFYNKQFQNGDSFIKKCDGNTLFRVFIAVTTKDQCSKIDNFVIVNELDTWTVDFDNGKYEDPDILKFQYPTSRVYQNNWLTSTTAMKVDGMLFKDKMDVIW